MPKEKEMPRRLNEIAVKWIESSTQKNRTVQVKHVLGGLSRSQWGQNYPCGLMPSATMPPWSIC